MSLNLNQLKQYLIKDGYHHTSKYYNSTDFYKVDIEKLLDNAEQNFIMSDFDNVEEQEYIKIKVNPDLKNRMNEKVEAKHIKDVNIDFNRNSDDVKKDVKEYWFGKGKTNTTVVNNDKTFILNSKSAHEMFHKANRNISDNKGDMDYRKTLYNIIANTKELFKTSIPILSYKEAKDLNLKDEQVIHRYANCINTDIGNFIVIYTVKDRTDKNNKKNLITNTLTIYDLGTHKKSSSGDLVNPDEKSVITPSGTNIIMADLIDFVKGKVIEKAKNRNIERRNKEQKQKENNNNISFQKVADNRNLLMVHATKSYRLDDVLESGTLVAPSFAIVKKGTNHFNFGDIIFIRKPNKIDYQNDNIYDRDIYSPRLPQPDYMTEDGVFVSAYDYESMQRLYNKRPADFKRLYHSDSFDEYFKGAKKVINMGFTPSGNRKTIPYTNKNLLEFGIKTIFLKND